MATLPARWLAWCGFQRSTRRPRCWRGAGVIWCWGPGQDDAIERVASAHPEILADHPSTWFVMALDRWMASDADGIRHWTGRFVAHAAGERVGEGGEPLLEGPRRFAQGLGPIQLSCAHLWRAKLGLEPLEAAVAGAKEAAAIRPEDVTLTEVDSWGRSVLLVSLGATQGYIGELDAAISNLQSALGLCRSFELPALAASAMTHLAMAEYMAGRESAAVEVATEAFSLLGDQALGRWPFVGTM